VASAAVASPVSREEQNALEQPDRHEVFKRGIFDSSKRGGARGFHEGIFDEGFGGFSTLKRKRMPNGGSRGLEGDAFTGGFGDFYTMKKRGAGGYDKMLDYLRAANYNKLANDAEHAY